MLRTPRWPVPAAAFVATPKQRLKVGNNMAHKKSKSAVPDRWTDYKALGKRIPGTRFVAFKVPLKPALRNLLPPSKVFGPMDLLQLLEEDNEQLGLIIDLTFTTRYYKPEDLPSSVQYVKIYTAGHAIPSDPVILLFKQAVRRFLQENSANDKLIGVHCTHGLNRTGYLICRYLIDVEGLDPSKAIELFNRSRGHAIERENYLEDLCHGPQRRILEPPLLICQEVLESYKLTKIEGSL